MLYTSALDSLAGGYNAASASLRRSIWKHDSANKYRDWAICVPSSNKDKINKYVQWDTAMRLWQTRKIAIYWTEIQEIEQGW